jgi:hypothetical protein
MSIRIPLLVFALWFIFPLGYSQGASRVANPSRRSKTIGQMAVENINASMISRSARRGSIHICISQ